MKTTEVKISATEKRVLISLHLQGCTGKMGSMNRAKRLALLQGLIAKGLMDKNCNPTKKGIELAAPTFYKN